MDEQDQNSSDGLSRREFVATSVAAGAAVALAGCSDDARMSTTAPMARSRTEASGMTSVTLHVNGEARPMMIDPRTTLLDALREKCELGGTKKGCDHGQCGACSVHVNGRRVLSCLTLAITHDQDQITTIEGLAQGEQLHPMQAAFIERDAFQCGYCTSGQIMSAVALLSEGHAHSEAEVKEQMSGNLCRCGAYPNICAAILDVMRDENFKTRG